MTIYISGFTVGVQSPAVLLPMLGILDANWLVLLLAFYHRVRDEGTCDVVGEVRKLCTEPSVWESRLAVVGAATEANV